MGPRRDCFLLILTRVQIRSGPCILIGLLQRSRGSGFWTCTGNTCLLWLLTKLILPIKNRAVKIYSPLLQPFVPSPCGANNGGCEKLCIVTRTPEKALGYVCAC